MKRRRQNNREESLKRETVLPSILKREEYLLFPNYSIHVLLFIVFLGRLSYVTDPISWWTLHPDEIYQVIEVSHADVYGYGFESPGHQRPLYSESGLKVPRESMRGIYSWVIPKIYSWALFCKEALQIPTRPYLFCRQLHTIMSGLLPVSIFIFCRRLYPEWPTDVATIAALVVAFGDYFVVLGTHTLPQSLLCTALFAASSLLYKADVTTVSLDTNDNYSIKSCKGNFTNRANRLSFVCAGFFQSLICYTKPDSIILVLVLHIALYREAQITDVKGWLVYLVGLIIGSFCGYCTDLAYYGTGSVSPLRWAKFQFWHSGNVYGSNGASYYIEQIILNPGVQTVLVIASVFVAILYAAVTCTSISKLGEFSFWASENRGTVFMSCKLSLCFGVLISILSVQPHKNMSYIHDALVLLSCSGAAALFCVFQLIKSLSQNQDKVYMALKLFVYAEAILYGIRSCSPVAMKTRFAELSGLVIPGTTDTWHVNHCVNFVGSQPDLTGLMLDHPVHLFGGYTVLHRNVPLIAKTHFDFREWDFKSRINFTSDIALSMKQSLSSFDKISNYVAEENGKLVLLIVSQIQSPYNYAILTGNRQFPKQGFREVFRSGNVTVFRRLKTKRALEYLNSLADKIPVGNDVQVLQVEASWLLSFGLPSIAVARLERALAIDRTCLPCWQLLHAAYVDLGRLSDVDKTARDCVDVLGKQKCAAKTKIIPLHPGYSLGMSKPRQPKPIVLGLS